jgi:DNA-binding response OmpR family regulator
MVQKIDKKVLLVEDDEDFLSILKIKFESEGLSVVTAKNGEEAVIAAEKEKPDLIISDILMPKMDGIEMAKKIKENDKSAVIVFLTNIKDVDYTSKIEKSGDFEYWIKSDLRIEEIVEKSKQKLGIK